MKKFKFEFLISLFKIFQLKKGVIYIGHLPYGFDENGIREFYSQFGEVTKVKLARSKKVNKFFF